MKIVPIESVPVEEVPHVREGIFLMQKLINGEPGTPGNFSLMLSRTPDTYYSPRHRHNFDQVRYQLEGEFDFTRDGMMGPGMIGYFPEGIHYGPQDTKSSSLTLVLQFGGDSGSGYLSREEYDRAAEILSAKGVFSKGVYTVEKPGGGKTNKDAYEAVWEQVHGRPLQYPKTEFTTPVFINPGEVDWEDIDQPGVQRKTLGVFSDSGTRIQRFRIQPDSKWIMEDICLYFVDDGEGVIDGQAYTKHTSVHVEAGEAPVIEAAAVTDILQLGMPAQFK